MPLLRGRRDDGGTTYQMREKLFAIGDDYWIETDDGERVFKVNGKAFRIRDTLVLDIPEGRENEIAPDQDDALILAVTVCIDQMTHDVG